MKLSDKWSCRNIFSTTYSLYITMFLLFSVGIVIGISAAFNDSIGRFLLFLKPNALFDSQIMIKASLLVFTILMFICCSFLAPALLPVCATAFGGLCGYIICTAMLLNPDKLIAVCVSLLPIIFVCVPVILMCISEAMAFWIKLICVAIKKNDFDFGFRFSVMTACCVLCFVITCFAVIAQSRILSLF